MLQKILTMSKFAAFEDPDAHSFSSRPPSGHAILY